MNNDYQKVMYIQATTGIAGDMFIAACVDAGVDRDYLVNTLKKCFPDILDLSINTTKKMGIRALILHTECSEQTKHRHWQDIKKLIEDIPNTLLSMKTKNLALKIFETVALAESYIHNTSIERVHFHEVGALDSLLDIVGAALCIELLKVDKIYCAPLPVGSGQVKCAHGVLPIPAPATAQILQGIPLASSNIEAELTTPTGAAIIKVICTDFITSMPSMVINSCGYGAGTRDLSVPNILRVFLGEQAFLYKQSIDYTTEELVMIETTIDDAQPEQIPQLIELLHDSGALEVAIYDAILKKGRTGKTINVLCNAEHTALIKKAIFLNSTSLGVRSYNVLRDAIKREFHNVTVRGLIVRMKIGKINQEIVNVSPEFADCIHVAKEKSIALKIIYQEAIAAWYNANPLQS